VKLRAATALSVMRILAVAPWVKPAQNRFGSRFAKRWKSAMNLHKPSKTVFLIAVALAVMALVGFFLTVFVLTQYQFWFVLAAFLLLALGCIL
jgi:hypothetical protein